jgi:cytochrome P450
MRPRVKAVVEDLLGGLEGKATADFVADFAFPLPAIVIAELLGVPPGDRELFKSWSADLKALVFGALDDGQRHQRARQAIDALSAYFADLVAHYRRRPGDNLISSFLVPEAGRPPVDAGELIPMLILLLFAGHETTTNLLANGLLALLRNPDQLDRLRQEPSAMTSAVEELLRFDGPAKLSVRWVASDLEMRGTRIAKGDRLLLVNASANRDPRRFADPDRLDLGRTDNAHLAFGYGRHYCLGASLARLEASLAFSTITERLPRIQLQADGELRWQPTILGRELEQLPIRLS